MANPLDGEPRQRFDSEAPNPISLKQINGKDYSVELTAKQLHKKILIKLEKLQSGKFEEIDKEYFNLSVKETLLTWSIMETTVGVTGLIGVLILNSFI